MSCMALYVRVCGAEDCYVFFIFHSMCRAIFFYYFYSSCNDAIGGWFSYYFFLFSSYSSSCVIEYQQYYCFKDCLLCVVWLPRKECNKSLAKHQYNLNKSKKRRNQTGKKSKKQSAANANIHFENGCTHTRHTTHDTPFTILVFKRTQHSAKRIKEIK